MAKLGRVTDPAALEADEGARARLRVAVPEAWLVDGAAVEVTAPKVLCCDRCGGGGCDGCAKSGALRAPEAESARRVVVRLPAGEQRSFKLRLPAPFDDHPIRQLMLTVASSLEPDARVRRLDRALAPARRINGWWLAACCLALAIAAFIFAR